MIDRRTLSVCVVIVLVDCALRSIWYATSQTGAIPFTPEWTIPFRRYFGVPTHFLSGVLIGIVARQRAFYWTVAVGAMSAAAGAVLHWWAGQLGVYVDWGTPAAAAMVAALSFMIYTPLALLGTLVGHFVSAFFGSRLPLR